MVDKQEVDIDSPAKQDVYVYYYPKDVTKYRFIHYAYNGKKVKEPTVQKVVVKGSEGYTIGSDGLVYPLALQGSFKQVNISQYQKQEPQQK